MNAARRSPPLSLGERRSWWIGFLGEVCVFAQGQAMAGDGCVDRQDQAVFAHQLARARGTAFPLPYASAGALREALLAAATGLVRAERGLERELLGRAVEACARGLSQLLDEDVLAQAEVWKRRMGED